MNSTNTLEHFERILKRNNYIISREEDGSLKIAKQKQDNPLIKSYLISAIVSIIAAVLALAFGSLWGIAIGFTAVPLFMKVMSFKKREEENGKTKIIISEKHLEVELEDTIYQCPKEIIKDLPIEVERDEHIYAGAIYLDTEEAGRLKILEIFGEQHNFVKDDINDVRLFILKQFKN